MHADPSNHARSGPCYVCHRFLLPGSGRVLPTSTTFPVAHLSPTTASRLIKRSTIAPADSLVCWAHQNDLPTYLPLFNSAIYPDLDPANFAEDADVD